MKHIQILLTIAALIATSHVAQALSLPHSLYERAKRAVVIAHVKVVEVADEVKPADGGFWLKTNRVKVIRVFKGDMKEKDAIIYTHTKDPKLTELERKAAEEKDPEKRRELFTEIMMNMENGDPKPNLSAGNEYILFLHQKKQAGHYRVFYSHSVIRATEKRLKAMEQATNPELWSWGPEINGLQLGAYIEEPHCAYQDRFEKGKFIIEGIVLGVRNTSDKTINLCDGPARVTVSVNGKQFVQPDDEALKLKSKDRPWTLEPGALQPLAENNHHHRDSRYPCWFELPMVDDLKDYKELSLTFTFTPQKDESGDTWQGKLSSGPLVVTEEEDDPVNHERGQSPLAD